jgi:hypothetical protein
MKKMPPYAIELAEELDMVPCLKGYHRPGRPLEMDLLEV